MRKNAVSLAGTLCQTFVARCLHCGQLSHVYGWGDISRTRAEKRLRKAGWSKTAKGWAHTKCYKEHRHATR